MHYSTPISCPLTILLRLHVHVTRAPVWGFLKEMFRTAQPGPAAPWDGCGSPL